jgi:hypothetical protein
MTRPLTSTSTSPDSLTISYGMTQQHCPLLHQKFESLHIELKASNGSIAEDNYAKADRRYQDSAAELTFGDRKDRNESRDQDLGPSANAKVP